ncbi:MAG: AMP-binding protein [Planctomycetota bacterium]
MTANVHNTTTNTLRNLLPSVSQGNAFYQPILESAGLTNPETVSIERFIQEMPLTTKQHLVDDQLTHPPYGSNQSFPLDHYTRFCQTSGTTGRPLRIIDTPESWQSMLDIWRIVFEQAGCTTGDRVLFAFSFGPFLGFWTAYEAAAQMGLMCLPAGGMSTSARLAMIHDNRVNTICCTPTYALHLAEVAKEEGIDLTVSSVTRLIVAGEPGGSLPAVRGRIESAWGARLYDHHGMTEIGPVTYQDNDVPGCLRIADGYFLVEVIDPQTTESVEPGNEGELILTTLKRTACPLLRYRTGDLVKQDPDDPMRLVGGILGRIDDMRLIRGVNVYPSAIDAVVRRFEEVSEYEVLIEAGRAMHELSVRIEPGAACSDVAALCRQVAEALRDALSLRVPVSAAAQGSLPKFEMKAKRWREVTS